MEKTIYNVYVLMENQEQCDRMRKLCIDNNLPIWGMGIAFELLELSKFFGFFVNSFWVGIPPFNSTQVTENEFIKLLEQWKK